ncbi:MAG TPA: LUD domain-containing protein [Gaiellaceae bacterium]|nr:LUD domain-containing protein [Gaiellaceae bacterium]
MTQTIFLDDSFSRPAAPDTLERVAAALRDRGFDAQVVADAARARQFVADLVPVGTSVLTAMSETVRACGLDELFDNPGGYDAIRPKLRQLDYFTEADERRRLGAAPETIVGSAQAITEDGRIVAASATGSQLGPMSFGAGRVILVVGAQKVVPDLDTALRRVRDYCLPLEDIRALKAYGQHSVVAKLLILERETHPHRVTIVITREAVGY